MFHVEPNKKNLHCETKDYLVTGEKFKVYLDQNNVIGKTFPVPPKEQIHKYYDSLEYHPHSLNKKTLSGFLYETSRKYMHGRKLIWMKKYINQKSKVLDYGCGSGDFVKYLRSNAVNAYGYDPNIKFNADDFGKYLTYKENWKNQKYQIIFLWHVLEHTHEPFHLIEELKKHLNKNGKIFIALPNFKSFDSKYYGKYWAGYDLPRHLWHFSRKIIYQIAKKSNLIINKEKSLLLDAMYVSFLSEKNKSSQIPLFLGALIGFLSFLKSFFTKESSSFLFILKKH